MTTAYTNDLRLAEMATGENAGTWGTTTNTNLELIAEAFGYGTENMGSDANTTITMSDGATDAVRSIYLKITSTTLTATREVTLAPSTISKLWIIENATTGGQSITIKQGSGATITIPNGSNKVVVTDGAGAGAAVYDALANQDVDIASGAITGGTIDGVVIGGSTAAAGTFTTLSSTGNTTLGDASGDTVTVNGTVQPGVVVSGSSSGDAVRITQTGAGNALVVEDDTNPDSTPFVIDASGQVSVGATPTGAVKLGVTTSDSGVTPNTTGDDLFVESSGNTGMTIGSGTASQGRIYFADSDDAIAGRVGYDHTNDSLYFGTNGVNQRLLIESGGTVKVLVSAYNPITTDNDLSFNQAASNNFKCTPSGSGTLTFTNHTDGQSGNILLINTGGHAISLAATTKGDANLATTISTAGTYWLSYYDDGTNAYVTTSAAFA